MVGAVVPSVEPGAPLGLREAVQTELAFLRHVHSHADILYDPEVIKLACCRYEYIWLPLLKADTKAVPPVDIAFVWHCHVLSPARYAAACGVAQDATPDFTYPTTPPPASATAAADADPCMRIALTSRTAAITSMRQTILKWAASRPAAKGTALPPLQHGDELAAAVARHKDFYYQVSLPHYRDLAFIDVAVGRYETFLSLHRERPHTVLRPPCDIELVRRAHLCMPAAQRGRPAPPPPHGDSHDEPPPAPNGILARTLSRSAAANTNGHSACLEHGELDVTTRAAFGSVGRELFRGGAQFRGVPSRQTVRQREGTWPGIKVSIARCDWHAEGPAHSAAAHGAGAPPATITGWKLSKASLLGGGGSTPYSDAGASVVLRNRESASLQLSVQVAEGRPDGNLKTVSASGKGKVNPVLLMQEDERTVSVRIQVKLKYAPVRNWLAVITLQLADAHDVIACGFPVAAGALAAWPHIRSVPASRAEVSQPSLLLPPSAVVDTGPDVAESLTFTVNGEHSTAKMRGPQMQIKITSTTKHLATIVEVFAASAPDPTASMAGSAASGASGAPSGAACSTPAATAHSVNLEQLPVQADLGGAAPAALDVGAAERAFVLRSADEDWGILIGRWQGQKLANPVAQTPPEPGYLAWRLVVLEDPRMSNPDPASRGYAGVVRMRAGAKRSQEKVFCGDSGWAWLVCSASTGQFRLEFEETSPGPATSREAGRLAALLAALSSAVGLLHVLCMPCTRSVAHPENPLQTLHDVTADSRGFVASWENAPHCRLLSAFSFLPTSAYVCKRLFVDRACTGVKEHKGMQPWFGAADEATATRVGRVFWGGRIADDAAMAELRAAWAHLPPSRKSSAAMSAQTAAACAGCGGDVGACGGCGAVTGGSPIMRGGSVAMSSGSLI